MDPFQPSLDGWAGFSPKKHKKGKAVGPSVDPTQSSWTCFIPAHMAASGSIKHIKKRKAIGQSVDLTLPGWTCFISA